jgi:hypothetical protein
LRQKPIIPPKATDPLPEPETDPISRIEILVHQRICFQNQFAVHFALCDPDLANNFSAKLFPPFAKMLRATGVSMLPAGAGAALDEWIGDVLE